MAHFDQAFWSSNYVAGIGVLFSKLQQGIKENQQMLTIARMRADTEDVYGQNMAEIGLATDRITGGFSRDEGASVRKAYDGMRAEMEEASRKHHKIASNIRELIVYPFSRWSELHAVRVQNSQDELQARIKAHDRQAEVVRKLRSQYFNKCRLVEDIEEEDKLAFKDPATESPKSPKQKTPRVKIQELDGEAEQEPVELGDQLYPPDEVKKILTHMLSNLRLGETKVPILGTYQNVSTGTDIVEYIQSHMQGTNVTYAERLGQDLIANGFLRLVGSVGNTFANSSKMTYQWRPKAFQLIGWPEKRKPDLLSINSATESTDSPFSGAVGEYLAGWNPLNAGHPDETPGEKVRREAREADERYQIAVRKLDLLRCTLEEAMVEHLKFMEKCELDRLKAFKSVILDYSGAISNIIPSLQSSVDKMMLFQETVQPQGDLRYLLENYRTGVYMPKVQIYENYYNLIDEQTFGVDLEARARSDRKRVPLLVTTILTYLDNHYPLLDGDEARRGIWLVDVPLAATHRLRNEINNGKIIPFELLERYEVPIVASVLKLYLLELPDSLVSTTLYDIIKTVYSSPSTTDASPSALGPRIAVLQNTLGQLRLANIATLDAITTHFVRLIDLTSADDQYITQLAQSLALCILRPRSESSLSFEEKYNYRFLRDLLANKDTIFGELKRAISLSHSTSVLQAASSIGQGEGQRTTSTNESNRRAHVEERNRAIASRSRTNSPTPNHDWSYEQMPAALEQQRLRRDSSKGPAETRFPVHPATAAPKPSHGVVAGSVRYSLEVPGDSEKSLANGRVDMSLEVQATSGLDYQDRPDLNGHTVEDLEQIYNPVVEDGRRHSVGRTPTPLSRFVQRKHAGIVPSSVRQGPGIRTESTAYDVPLPAMEGKKIVGVELMDKPMDD